MAILAIGPAALNTLVTSVPPPAIAPEKRVMRVSEPLLSQEELRALLDGDGLPLPDAPNGSNKEASS